MRQVPARLLLALAGFLFAYCNTPDLLSTAKTEFIPSNPGGTHYTLSRNYFVLRPGDRPLLYGTVACTVITNGIPTSTVTDSLYCRAVTKKETSLTIGSTNHVVTPQVFQQAQTVSGLAASSITRYFSRTSGGVLQLAAIENGTMTYFDKSRTMVLPMPIAVGYYGTTYMPGNNWDASPLIPLPIAGLSGPPVFEAHSIATRVLAPDTREPPYLVRGIGYHDGVEIKTYYTLSGTALENGTEVSLLGDIVITSHYFSDSGLVDQFQNQRLLKTFADGKTERTIRSAWVARGPGSMRLDSDAENLYGAVLPKRGLR